MSTFARREVCLAEAEGFVVSLGEGSIAGTLALLADEFERHSATGISCIGLLPEAPATDLLRFGGIAILVNLLWLRRLCECKLNDFRQLQVVKIGLLPERMRLIRNVCIQ